MLAKNKVFVFLFCMLFLFKTAALFKLKRSTNDSVVTHYIDDNGVKVEKQIKEAIIVQTGVENYTDPYNAFGNGDETNSYDDDEESEEDYNNSSKEDNTGNPTAFSGPSSVFDIFTALHTAWREVEKFREKNAKAASSRNQTEDDRLRREPNESEDIKPLTPSPTKSISQARYIKGDPLKGYYDFVITEGSYKFWAAFQLATAALVIYSTFAAIYYSKVNPIVADYDYVDYLGGGRSLSNADVDYHDPTDGEPDKSFDSNNKTKTKQSQWSFSWPPPLLQNGWKSQFGTTVRTVFDVIDKFS